MDRSKLQQLDQLLLHGLESLCLTETQHQDAVSKFEAVGRWLNVPGSILAPYSPTVFAHGSMAIGTTNKPVGRDERDIDLVCEMLLPDWISQADGKSLLGRRIKEHATYAEMLEEKNRCWRLIYAGAFHMDILPAKPDERMPTPTALLVPDAELQHWKETDPKGYAAWFLKQAMRYHTALRRSGVRAGVEPAPDYQSVWDKLPLQIAVQILKSHRDLCLNGDDDAPISIILTTLAAHAYRGQESIFAALLDLIDQMPLHIEYDEHDRPFVRNPMNYRENFAEKWHDEPRKARVFAQWIRQIKADLLMLQDAVLSDAVTRLMPFLGESTANRAVQAYGEQIHRRRGSGLQVATSTGLFGASGARSTPVRENTFFGSERIRQD